MDDREEIERLFGAVNTALDGRPIDRVLPVLISLLAHGLVGLDLPEAELRTTLATVVQELQLATQKAAAARSVAAKP